MSLSEVAELTSGTVHGSVIGPLWFLIFINDLIEHLKKSGVSSKLFADDVKIYAEIVDTLINCGVPAVLDSVNEWSLMCQLPISVNKCCILHIRSATSCRPLCINGSVLPIVKTCRDYQRFVTACAHRQCGCKGPSTCQCHTEVFCVA